MGLKFIFISFFIVFSSHAFSQHIIDFTIPPCPHVFAENKTTEDPNFVLYPNPTFGNLFIELKNLVTIKDLRIYDVYGRVMMHEDVSGSNAVIIMNLESITKGFYILEVCTPSHCFQKPFLKY